MTQQERLLAMMKGGKRVSSMDAFQTLGITRISATVFELRKDGIKVLDEWKEGLNRFGEKVRYKVFFMEDENNAL